MDNRRAGFSLLEALVALVIASMVLAAIATLGAQILRNWMRGQETISALEMLQRGLGRLETDFTLALPMPPPGSESGELMFKGDAQNLLFPAATGLGAGNKGLELLSLTVTKEGDITTLVRRRGPIANVGTVLGDPVALLRGRMTMSLSYRDANGQIVPTWDSQKQLPSAVLLDIRGASGLSLFPTPVVMPLMINLPVQCLQAATGTQSSGDDDDDDNSSKGSGRQQQQQCASAAGGTQSSGGDSDSQNDSQGNGGGNGASQ
jgi:general secretion pathway protein J